MTLVPAVLVLAVGSELIRTSVGRWFNVPMDEILSSANEIAADYYQERQLLVADHAARIASAAVVRRPRAPTTQADCVNRSRRRWVRTACRSCRCTGSWPAPSGSSPTPIFDVAAPQVPRRYSRAAADQLAAQVLGGSDETRVGRDVRQLRRPAPRGGADSRRGRPDHRVSSSPPTSWKETSRRGRAG